MLLLFLHRMRNTMHLSTLTLVRVNHERSFVIAASYSKTNTSTIITSTSAIALTPSFTTVILPNAIPPIVISPIVIPAMHIPPTAIPPPSANLVSLAQVNLAPFHFKPRPSPATRRLPLSPHSESPSLIRPFPPTASTAPHLVKTPTESPQHTFRFAVHEHWDATPTPSFQKQCMFRGEGGWFEAVSRFGRGESVETSSSRGLW
ncbi:hypothetical protein K458DRAFT_63152 [Lentithecium fluviatile CBS 122367]|uniref:Uncharacterized protein n=1 Tax=Lentithecium fluviatile CBS 122367 TaxID=1168545 RepID=A0A6G1JKW7_9PLEO|nr:hypothetical protein K458DRAFT_63152 [Lentithecium fluviatile CBS 122367]